LFKPPRAARESGFLLQAASAPPELRNGGEVQTNSIRCGAEYPGASPAFASRRGILIASWTRLYTRRSTLALLQKPCNGLIAHSATGALGVA
jgi:hypothetical protein